MKRIFPFLILGLGGLITGYYLIAEPNHDIPASSDGYVGTLPGNFSVSNNGTATYSLDLNLTPGTIGLEPKLSVVYNNQGNNGILGQGVRLNGLSVITRTGAQPALDGFRGPVAYDSLDRFTMNGQRLMAVNGAYGAAGTDYHTEIESWKKITANGQTGSGPNSFTVLTKNGVRMEFGGTTDSRILDTEGRGVRVWALNELTDLNGNTVVFEYDNDTENGSYYPKSIRYTGNTKTGETPNRSVSFYYANRPDTITSYEGGGINRTTKRLERVTTFAGADSTLVYTFAYNNASITGKSLLDRISKCDNAGKCLTPGTLKWQDGDPGLLQASQPLAAKPNGYSLLPMDVDGNGLSDLVNIVNSPSATFRVITYLSNGKELIYTDSLGLPGSFVGSNELAADVNGDGRVDLIFQQEGSISPWTGTLFLSNGSGFDQTSVYTPPSSVPSTNGQLMALDVNGDTRSDLIYVQYPGLSGNNLTISTYFSTGTDFAYHSTQSIALPAVQTTGQLYASDVNGDKMTDLTYAASDGYGNDSIQFSLLLSNGTGYTLADHQSFAFFGGKDGIFMPSDVNGDNLYDLIYIGATTSINDTMMISTFFSNGKNYETGVHQKGAARQSVNTGTFFPADMNGDRRYDLVYVDRTNNTGGMVTAYVSQGASFGAGQQLATTTGTVAGIPMPMDLNGDAITDVVYAVAKSAITGPVYDLSWYASGTVYPDLMDTVDNGQGGIISIAYKPQTDTTVYKRTANMANDSGELEEDDPDDDNVLPAYVFTNPLKGSTYQIEQSGSYNTMAGSSFPVTSVQYPIYAVSSYAKSNSIGSHYGYSCFYENARISTDGYGWLGFEKKVLYDSTLQSINTSYYRQDYPFVSQVSQSIVQEMGSKDTMTKLDLCYQYNHPVAGDTTIFQVEKTGSLKSEYSYNQPDYTLGIHYAYDAYGNLIKESDYGNMASRKNSIYTLNSYQAPDLNRWLIGYRINSTKTSDSTGADSSKILTNLVTHYADSTMNPVLEKRWNNQLDSWLSYHYGYDVYGNKIFQVSPAGDSTLYAFDPQYHTYMVEQQSPRNVAGRRLTTQFTYFEGFGAKRSSTDANGKTIAYSRDGMGRIRSVTGPDPSGNPTELVTNTWVSLGDSGYYVQSDARLNWAGTSSNWIRKYTDGLSRQYQMVSQGVTENKARYSTKAYDSKNRLIKESAPYFSGDPVVYSRTVYDAAGRIIRTAHPKGNNDSIVAVYTYEGLNIHQTEAYGTPDSAHVVSTIDFFNSKDKVVARKDELNGTTTYTFDLLAQSTGSIDPGGNPTLIQYNTLGNKILESNPASGTTAYIYVDTLSVVYQIPANADTITSLYDGMGRLLSATTGSGSAVSYAYDLENHANSQGRISVAHFGGQDHYTYAYDDYGNVDTVSLHIDNVAYSTITRYLPNHKPDQVTYPDGSVLQYSYFVDGTQDSLWVTDALEGNISRTAVNYNAYNAFSKPLLSTYGNRTVAAWAYFPGGQLESSWMLDSGNDTLFSHEYERNYRNRICEIRDATTGGGNESARYAYDPTGRLYTASGAYGDRVYQYDESGNLTQKDSIEYGYSNWQVNYGLHGTDTVFKAQYDELGNMLERQLNGDVVRLGYDAWNRLSTVTLNDTLYYKYTYDDKGRRIMKEEAVAGQTVLYINANFDITYLSGSDSSLITKYVPGASGPVAAYTAGTSGRWDAATGSGKGWAPVFPSDHAPGKGLKNWLYLLYGLLALCGAGFFLQLLRVHFNGRLRRTKKWATGLAMVVFLPWAMGIPTTLRAAQMQEATGTPVPGALYFHLDYLSSVRLTTNESGLQESKIIYKPYGEVYQEDGPDNFRPKFNGKEFEARTGLYYFSARYYDASCGRFTSADTQLGGHQYQSDSYNRYAFTLNNPVNYNDPTGNNVFSWINDHVLKPIWNFTKKHTSALASMAVSGLEIVVGVTLDVVGDALDLTGIGAVVGVPLDLLGGALLGAGINGFMYSATHFNNFSWKDWGIQEGIGAAVGVFTEGLGAIADVGAEGAEAGVSEMMEEGSAELSGMAEEGEAGLASSAEDATIDLVKCGDEGECFVAGTEIATPQGEKAIEHIKVGDIVWSFNEKTGRKERNKVVHLFKHAADTIVEVVLPGDTLETTTGHRFWSNSTWVEARDLQQGDVLSGLKGQSQTILSVKMSAEKRTVYNFEVDVAHTYYAGRQPVLVHNVCVSYNYRISEQYGRMNVNDQWQLYDHATNLMNRSYNAYDHALSGDLQGFYARDWYQPGQAGRGGWRLLYSYDGASDTYIIDGIYDYHGRAFNGPLRVW